MRTQPVAQAGFLLSRIGALEDASRLNRSHFMPRLPFFQPRLALAETLLPTESCHDRSAAHFRPPFR